MANHKDTGIPLEQLYKWDIWAFGLCVWETLADGQVYLQDSWISDRTYCISLMHASSSTKTRDQSPGKALPAQDAHDIFGDFDLSQLKDLAKQFVNTMYIPGVGLEKAILQGLFERTLHSEPAKRIAELSRLPIMEI